MRRLSTLAGDMLTWALLALPGDVGYRLARRTVDRHRGDNNNDFARNGELLVLRALLPGCDVVFDAGANIGDWTDEALRVHRNAVYHCFEPVAATFRKLSGRNFPSNVRLHPFAVGAKEEERTIFVYGDTNAANTLYPREGLESAAPQAGETIRVTTLDAFCERERIPIIDFLKVDVEGHEISVFEGAARLLSRGAIRFVQFEYGGAYIDSGRMLRDVWRVLAAAKADYNVYKILPRGLLHVPAYRQAWETYQHSNWLLVHRDAVASLPAALLVSSP